MPSRRAGIADLVTGQRCTPNWSEFPGDCCKQVITLTTTHACFCSKQSGRDRSPASAGPWAGNGVPCKPGTPCAYRLRAFHRAQRARCAAAMRRRAAAES
jgi:hypothetical protein